MYFSQTALLTSLLAGGSNRPWRPIFLTASVLLIMTTITTAMIALLKQCSRISRRDGGITFAKHSYSSLATFVYLYLPTFDSGIVEHTGGLVGS